MKVPYSKSELAGIISKNREEHSSIVVEALAGYKEHIISKLNESLDQAKTGKIFDNPIWIQPPVDHTADYDRVLRQLTLTTAETVELDDEEFESFVMDRWKWRDRFLMANSMYSNKAIESMKK